MRKLVPSRAFKSSPELEVSPEISVLSIINASPGEVVVVMMGFELEVLRKSFHTISDEKDSETAENNSEDTEKNNRTANVRNALLLMKYTGKNQKNSKKVLNILNIQWLVLLIVAKKVYFVNRYLL